ncbi:MAG: nucleoside hydrolase [Bacilli bacterium]|nr:nucleoside hydrolase [Bacilli bacterium]
MDEIRKIILDCDPGHDDAIALALAGKGKGLELLGIGVEAGNQTLGKTGRNALSLVEYLGLDVPVALGADRPIKRSPLTCPEIHGETGLDGFPFKEIERKFDERDAITMMKDLLLANDKVTLVPTGPLTNIGLLLQTYPEVKPHIEKIVLMGGSMGMGNVTPAAEFNILCDPEAADIVFSSGLPIYMLGLDVTRKALVTPKVIKKMKKVKNKAAKLFVTLMQVYNENQFKTFGLKGGPLHDPATIVALLNKDVFTFKKMNVSIDTSGGPSYGRTNCDISSFLGLPANAYVATDIDRKLFFKTVKKTLERYSK